MVFSNFREDTVEAANKYKTPPNVIFKDIF